MTLLKVIVLSRFLGNDKIFKDLIQAVGFTLLVLLFFLEIIKKRKKSFFIYFYLFFLQHILP